MNKEEIVKEYIEMINKSWTYERLTEEEKNRLINLFYHVSVIESLKYSKSHIWEILHDIYYSYIIALGYDPLHWREPEEIPLF